MAASLFEPDAEQFAWVAPTSDNPWPAQDSGFGHNNQKATKPSAQNHPKGSPKS
jgi:hypothetical protein